jgi:hypothetical protein
VASRKSVLPHEVGDFRGPAGTWNAHPEAREPMFFAAHKYRRSAFKIVDVAEFRLSSRPKGLFYSITLRGDHDVPLAVQHSRTGLLAISGNSEWGQPTP